MPAFRDKPERGLAILRPSIPTLYSFRWSGWDFLVASGGTAPAIFAKRI